LAHKHVERPKRAQIYYIELEHHHFVLYIWDYYARTVKNDY